MKNHLKWLLPLLLLVIFTPFSSFLDLKISGCCYDPEQGFSSHPYFQFLFRYGEQFGFAVGGVFLLLFLGSFLKPKWKKWRRGSFAVILTLVIGAGLITNTLLKGYWGRPRPKQIEAFGGRHAFRPFWHPDLHTKYDPQKSFPSGHVAMGFYFLSLSLVGRRTKSRTLFLLGLILSFGLGGNLMVARVFQGGHFLSDVLFSPILMWFVALGVDAFTWGEWGERFLLLKWPGTSQGSDDALAA